VHLNDVSSNFKFILWTAKARELPGAETFSFLMPGSPQPYSTLLLIRFVDHFTNFIFIVLV